MPVTPEPGWRARADGPYRVRHTLADTGLFDVTSLAAIARGRAPADIPCGGAGHVGEPDPEEVIGAIETTAGWAVLRDQCWSGEHARELDAAFASIAVWVQDHEAGVHERDRSGIVTSRRAVTHLHIDVDESFLLQVQGYKTVGFVPPDVLEPDDVARVVLGRPRRLTVPRDRVIGRLAKFVLGPGDGVHVPFGWPHFTRVEGDASVSMSLAFQSDRTSAVRAAVRQTV